MEVRLVMFKGDGRRRDFKITRPTSTIGRSEECSLRIPLANVSRQHCELILSADELRVRDLASSNGTYVNNRRINETALRAGDRLKIGPVTFTVQVNGQPEQVASAPAKPAKAKGEVVELEADDTVDFSELGVEGSDPITALEALAEDTSEDDQPT